MEVKEMNIYQKMLAITTELETVAKNLSVGTGQSSYKAVGEADVLRAVKPLEEKYGVYSYPYSRQIVDSAVLESVSTYNGKETVKRNQFMRLEIIYRFVNVDKPSEYVDVTTYGDGIDTGDKAPGKAMTYGDKYALMKGYKITTGDDPDQHASEELKSKTSNVQMITESQVNMIMKMYEGKEDLLPKLYEKLGITSLNELTLVGASNLIKQLNAKKG